MRNAIFGGALAIGVGAMAIGAVLSGDDRDDRSDRDDGHKGPRIEASGVFGTLTPDVAAFDRIHVKGALELEVDRGDTPSVEIEGDQAFIDALSVTVEEGRLFLGYEKNTRLTGDGDLLVKIVMPTLSDLEIEGAIDGDISGMEGGSLNIEINGAADLRLSGNCDALSVVVNGAADVEARDYECREVSVTLNGAGDAEVFASEEVTIAINGIGDVDVYGSPPKVSRKKGGLGSVTIN